MSQAILKLDKITKDYKVADSAVHALRGVSLNFRSKEFVAVLGHSGCGKTTLLNIIGGLDHYTSGDLVIKGRSTKHYKDADWDAYRNHSIGFVFQSYNLIPHQTVLENVELALTLSGIRPQERRERATHALERVGLGGELHKRPNQLSGGQMQRVAIARALVNNPEILLADEPTGALDSETSVQIMDLIREIAGERLVIMVTHNPELARRYSTRIVELKDGQIVGDSDPFEPDEEYAEEGAAARAANDRRARRAERKKREKTSMSFWTAFLLSGRNLLTKKGRTAVTSIAGSIGIISVCLVLALSNGFTNYIRKTEEDMLSYYPLEITETSLDPTSIMAGLQSAGDMPDLSELDNKVYVNSFLTQIAQGLTVSNDIGQNDGEYIDYLYDMPEEWYYAITQDTGATLVDNLFTTVTTGVGEEAKVEYRSLSSLKQYFINVLEDQEEKYAQMAYLVDYLGSVVNTMPGTSNFDNTEDRDAFGEYVLSQYDILYGDFPVNSNQAVLVVGTNNDMTDLLLAQLGYITEDDFLSLFELGGGEITGGYETDEIGDYLSFTFEELTEKSFTLYYNDAVYQKNESYVMPGSGHAFNYVGERTQEQGLGTNNGADGVEIEITAVLRLKDGLTYGCLSRGLNLTEQLVEEYVQVNKESQIVQWMNTPIDMNDLSTVAKGGYVTFGEGANASTIYLSPSAHLNGTYYTQITDAQRQEIEAQNPELGPLLDFLQELYITNSIGLEQAQRVLGGDDTPNSIAIYPRDFETKESILSYLDEWNAQADADPDDGKTAVQYTDTVGLLMGMVQTILDAITYVLVAFTGISLVVSTVMIGVITYVSVVERTKEIGVLRAIGARRKDIKRVFNAETFIIGMCSGCFGVVVAYLCQVIINAILTPLTGIAGLASLAWYAALIMIVISVVLTLISGLVPASAAAKRDPVVALRSE